MPCKPHLLSRNQPHAQRPTSLPLAPVNPNFGLFARSFSAGDLPDRSFGGVNHQENYPGVAQPMDCDDPDQNLEALVAQAPVVQEPVVQ